MKPLTRCLPPTQAAVDALLAKLQEKFPDSEIDEAFVRASIDVPTYKNDTYTVMVDDDGCARGMVHLSIKRNDREPIHDWRDLQEIKNQLCGREREAVELYPAESRRVDTANQYHLFVMAQRIPFGFTQRLVMGPVEGAGWKQREL